MKVKGIVLIFSLLITGCDYNFNKELVDGYDVGAIDSRYSMSIYGMDGNYSVGVIPPTVYAVGYNDSFIIAKQHPQAKPGLSADKTITHYFIIPVKANNGNISVVKNVVGPLDEAQFKRMRQEYSIPESLDFQIVFDDLK